MTSRHTERARMHCSVTERTLGRLLLSGALVCGAMLTVVASNAQVSSAASPNDYLCVVGSATQTTTESTPFADPLEVEISTTSCSSPTPDTSTNSVSFALDGTPSAAASFDTSAITTTSGFASVSATANSVAGSYSVIATSPATASSSSPSVTFSLTNSSLQSDTLIPDVSSYQSATVGAAFGLPLAVTRCSQFLFIFQNTSRGARNTPVTLERQAKGWVYWPTGMSGNASHRCRCSASSAP